jgi:ABC-2 type transport system permease protein
VNRYLHTLRLFWSTAIAAEMEYRLNFLLTALTNLGSLVGSLFGLSLFYRNGYQFAGWRWEEALVVLAMFTILQGFASTFLAPNLNRIVTQVQDGTLDFVLLKPISSQFWLSARTISPWGITDLVFGTCLLLYAGGRLNLSFGNYLASILPIALGCTSLYSLWFMLGATSIWFVKIYNVTEVLRSLLDAGRFPMAAYPVGFKFFFTFIIPIAFLTTVPAEVLLGRSEPIWLLGSLGLACSLLFASHCFWQFALRSYTSASS